MARSMARARLEQLLLVGERVGLAVLGGGTQALEREVAQLLLDRPQPFDQVLGVTHRVARSRSATERVGQQLGGMAHVEARRAEVHRAPGLADATSGVRPPGAAARIAATFRSRISPASSGWNSAYAPPAPQHRPSSAVSTQPVRGRQHLRHRALHPLHVPEVARVLDDHRPARSRRAAPAAARAEPFGEVARRAPRSGGPRRSPSRRP